MSCSMIQGKDNGMRKRPIAIYKAWDNINLGKLGWTVRALHWGQGTMDFSFPSAWRFVSA